MPKYQIANYQVSSSDVEAFQHLLGQSYNAPEQMQENARPKCLCWREEPGHENAEGIPMYIAKVNDQYVIKRMPNSALEHTVKCESYEMETNGTGYDEIAHSAVKQKDGKVTLKLDFSLRDNGGGYSGGGGDITRGPSEKVSAKAEGPKFTLRSFLHYLWRESELTKWSPYFAGRRSWGTVYYRITGALRDKVAKGLPLSDVLYMPEPWPKDATEEQKFEISRKRLSMFDRIKSEGSGSKKLMVVLGELKQIRPQGEDFQLFVKHAPDFPFSMDRNLKTKFEDIFKHELADVRGANAGKSHAVILATFSYTINGAAALKEVVAMAVNENWIPYDEKYEHKVIELLAVKNRRFEKVLRFNRQPWYPQPKLMLVDAAPKPTYMFIVPNNAGEDWFREVEERRTRLGDKYGVIIWNPMEPLLLPMSIEEAEMVERGEAVVAQRQAPMSAARPQTSQQPRNAQVANQRPPAPPVGTVRPSVQMAVPSVDRPKIPPQKPSYTVAPAQQPTPPSSVPVEVVPAGALAVTNIETEDSDCILNLNDSAAPSVAPPEHKAGICDGCGADLLNPIRSEPQRPVYFTECPDCGKKMETTQILALAEAHQEPHPTGAHI